MFSVSESGSGACRRLERKEYVNYMGNYTHFIFSTTSASTCIIFSYPSAEGSTCLWNMEHTPTKWWRNQKKTINLSTITMTTWKIISMEHVEWKVGGEWFQSQCGHVDREKNSCLWKEQNPGMPIHFTVWVTPAPEQNDNSWYMEVVVAICYL